MFGGARIDRYSPAGKLERTIGLPVENPTCVCLGGPDRRTLFITTARKFLGRAQLREQSWAGSLLAVDVETPGLPERQFG